MQSLERIYRGARPVLDAIEKRLVAPFVRYELRERLPTMENARLIAAMLDTASYVDAHMKAALQLRGTREVLRHAVVRTTGMRGLRLEFGVASGNTINLLAAHQPDEVWHGFDSFQGLSESWWHYERGHFSTNGKPPHVRKNVMLHIGWFADALPDFAREHENEPVAFAHIDSDLYSSAKTVFDFLRGRTRPGTVIVMNEYFNYPGWREHEFKAFAEFIAETGSRYEYLAYDGTGESVAIVLTAER